MSALSAVNAQGGVMATKRTNVLTESLYGEANTFDGWVEWLRQRFNQVPQEYRDSAVLEIDSVGGYEGENHTEADLYYDRPETDEERQDRRERELARAAESELLAARRLADAKAIRERLARE